ncbi:MAG: histidine phosphatase family protein [Desulfobacteria bacterium]
MKLHLIRHCRTDANSKGKLSCDIDEPLNTDGIRQATLLSDYLKTLGIDEIWCSPLLRARQTLSPLLDCSQTEPVFLPLLCEGHLNLDSSAPISAPEFSAESGFPMATESVGSFRGRVAAILSRARAVDVDRTVLCLTRGHFIRETLNIFLDAANYTRFPIGNCSDTLVEFGKDQIIHYVNRTTI